MGLHFKNLEVIAIWPISCTPDWLDQTKAGTAGVERVKACAAYTSPSNPDSVTAAMTRGETRSLVGSCHDAATDIAVWSHQAGLG